MACAQVKVTVSFFAEVDTVDYLDEDWEPDEEGEDEDDRPELSLSDAIEKFRDNLKDGTEDICEVIQNADELDDVRVKRV